MKKLLTLLVCMALSLVAMADEMYLQGSIYKYPIVIEMNYNPSTGAVSGRYAYLSTLEKQGKKVTSYLYFHGFSNIDSSRTCPRNSGKITVTDSNGNQVETWTNAIINHGTEGVKTFNCDVRLKNGKRYFLDTYSDTDWIYRYF